MQMLRMWMSEKKKEKRKEKKYIPIGGCRCPCSTSEGWWWTRMVAEVLTQHVLWDLENFVRVCAATVHY